MTLYVPSGTAAPVDPFVPYWVVAQREDTDVSALQGLIDIAEEGEEEDENDASEDFLKEEEDFGVEDFDEDNDEEYDDGEEYEGDEDEAFDDENYDDFIDEKF